MAKNITLALNAISLLLVTCAHAQPSVQHAGICAHPKAQSLVIDTVNSLWIDSAEMYDTKKHTAESAAKVLSESAIQKIKNGTTTKIIEIYARTADDKPPADCLAIAKSVITSTRKTINTPSYPIYYGVYQKKDGTIDIHIDNNSLDGDLIESVASNLVIY